MFEDSTRLVRYAPQACEPHVWVIQHVKLSFCLEVTASEPENEIHAVVKIAKTDIKPVHFLIRIVNRLRVEIMRTGLNDRGETAYKVCADQNMHQQGDAAAGECLWCKANLEGLFEPGRFMMLLVMDVLVLTSLIIA